MFKNLLITCFIGMLGILLGAFGAHSLKEILEPAQLLSFETAVRYQMYHVIVLLFVNSYVGFKEKQKNIISYLFFAGILLFCGSIYIIQLDILSAKFIWFVTPFGGLLFVFGWLYMALKFIKKIKNS